MGKSINKTKLIDSYEGSLIYPEHPFQAMYEYNESDVYMDVRNQIHLGGFDLDPRVVEIDKRLIVDIINRGGDQDLRPSVKEEIKDEPLESWWYHLNEIGKLNFPAEKLPEHLRETYLQKK